MRVFYLILFCSCILTSSLKAQTFSVEPDSILYIQPPMNEYSIHAIYLPNLTEDSLTMHWRIAEENMPVEWDYFLCDLGECYSAIPINSTMSTAFGEDIPYMEITMNPNELEAMGNLVFYVNDIAFPDYKRRIEFVFNTLSSSTEDLEENELQVFPNPFHNQLNMTTGQEQEIISIQIFNLNGLRIYEIQNPEFPLELGFLHPGTYILLARDDSQIYRKTILKKE